VIVEERHTVLFQLKYKLQLVLLAVHVMILDSTFTVCMYLCNGLNERRG
jgi:hypothetical protein